MNEEYTQSCELPSELNLEGLSEQEARAIKEALGRFMKSYQEKPEEQGDEAWLTQRFQEELPNLTAEQAQTLSRETLEEIPAGTFSRRIFSLEHPVYRHN